MWFRFACSGDRKRLAQTRPCKTPMCCFGNDVVVYHIRRHRYHFRLHSISACKRCVFALQSDRFICASGLAVAVGGVCVTSDDKAVYLDAVFTVGLYLVKEVTQVVSGCSGNDITDACAVYSDKLMCSPLC